MLKHLFCWTAAPALLLVLAVPAQAQNTTIFLEDFGNSAVRVPSIYVPQSGKDEGLADFAVTNTPFYTYARGGYTAADNMGLLGSYSNAISDGLYAIIQPAKIVSSGGGGWWANPGPDHSTATAPVKDGAVMVLNAGMILNQFYRRTFGAQPGATYRISAWRKSMTGDANAASWRFEAQSVVSETTLGHSPDIPNVALKVWEQSDWEFTVPITCTGNLQVAVALRNSKAANNFNDVLIDDILLEQVSVPSADAMAIACPAEVMSMVTAVDDAKDTLVNTAVAIPVTVNDIVTENGVFDYPKISFTQPAKGTVVVASDGVLQYTPSANFVGTDPFKYTICNTQQPTPSCSTATVTVNIRTPDLHPQDDSASTVVGTAVTIDAAGNDQADVGTAVLNGTVSTPTHGSAVVSNGKITYTPAANYVGDDTFTYGVCDQSQPQPICKAATVTVSITATLAAANDSAVTDQGKPVTIAVLGNDAAQAGPLAVRSISSSPAHGTAVPDGGGSIVYTPAAGFVGRDQFDYEVCDSAQPKPNCTTATVVVTVNAVAVPPDPKPPTPTPGASPTPVPGLGSVGLFLLSGLFGLAAAVRRKRQGV